MKPEYLPMPSAHSDAALLAIWPDGRLAFTPNVAIGAKGWHRIEAPDYAALFGPPRTCVGRWIGPDSWACACEGLNSNYGGVEACEECGATRPSVGPSAAEAEGATRG